jgi:septum formation protein
VTETAGVRLLILASASPRRSSILTSLGLEHRVVPARVDEAAHPAENPLAHVERLARAKAAAVAPLHREAWVLAGDTVVTVDGDLLGKPRNEGEAVSMLLRLQGRAHRVASGLALAGRGELVSGVEVTEVRFRPFDQATAMAYAASGEPMDKAGAYGIQGLGAALVEGITGDYSGVVGLPVPLLIRLLAEVGRPYRFPSRVPPRP